MKLYCLAVNDLKKKALLKSYQLFSMAAKEENACFFQEIVLAHGDFKPRIAASLSWSYIYRYFSANEAQGHKSALAFSWVPKMKWKFHPKGVHVRFGSKRQNPRQYSSCAVNSNAKNLRGLGRVRRLIFLWHVLFSRRGTGYEILT